MTQQYMDKLAEDRAALASRREENKGLVALAAAQALSKGSGLRQGLANMFGAVGAEAGRLSKDVRESEQLIRRSEMALAQAKQAREDGLNDKAMQLERQAYTDAVAAHNAKKTGLYEQQRLEQTRELDEARTTREEARIASQEERERKRIEAQTAAQIKVAEIQAGRDKSTDLTRMADSIEANLKRTNPEMSDEERRDLAFERAASRLGRYPADVRGGLATDQLRAAVEAAINKETESLRMQLNATRDPVKQADLRKKIDDIANSTRARYPSAYPPAGSTPASSAPSGPATLPSGFVPVK